MTLYGTGRALLRPRRRFVDTFDALLSRWQVVAGTLTVSGGALQASALGDWGNNLVSNGESWTGGPPPTGWGEFSCTIRQVDSATDPGASSGGVDDWCAKVTNTGAAPLPLSRQTIDVLVGATYRQAALAYAPSANTVEKAARLSSDLGVSVPTLEDVWQQLELIGVAANTPVLYDIRANVLGSTAIGDVAYFDSATLYRQNAAAIMSWSPTFRARLSHISPAAGVVTPAGWMFRYTNALNYWELRVVPNTAGNDLQIVQVTAGAETVRAEADVDWTAEGIDEVELIVRGSSITTRYRKAGGVWTAGPSYASATQGAQARAMGPMLYGTTTARWARAEVDW